MQGLRNFSKSSSITAITSKISLLNLHSSHRSLQYPSSNISVYYKEHGCITNVRSNSGGSFGRRSTCIECGSTRTHWDSCETHCYCENCKRWIYAGPPIPSDVRQFIGANNTEDARKSEPSRNLDWYAPSNIERNVGTQTGPGGRGSGQHTESASHFIPPTLSHKLKPRHIFEGLEEHVVGQRQVKRVLSVGMVNHFKRVNVNSTRTTSAYDAAASSAVYPEIDELESIRTASAAPPYISLSGAREVEHVQLDKSNVMVIGPTGSGKTLMAKVLAKLIDVPFVIFDATCLTEAGYVGEDVESILHKLYVESGNDVERAQRGIVYVDEIDKIRRRREVSTSRDVSGEGVQQGLLKMLEGTVVNVPKDGSRRAAQKEYVQIDTSDIMFICGGAFSGLEKIVSARKSKASIGFGANMKINLKDQEQQSKQFQDVESHDLITYGLIPEFVGRFATIVSTSSLTMDEMIQIITQPKNSLMAQYKLRFAMDDTDLHFTDCALKAIAADAIAKGTGARGLNAIMENLLMDASYEVPDMTDVNAVYIDEEVVRGKKPVQYIRGTMNLHTFLRQQEKSNSSEIDRTKNSFYPEEDEDAVASM